MGSALSCVKPKKEGGAIRPVPERRSVSASELQRPASSYSASTSNTLEQKRRQSLEVCHVPSPNVEPVAEAGTDVVASSIQKLVPHAGKKEEKGSMKIVKEEDMPNVGSTSDDIGATTVDNDETVGLIDIHVRADKALVATTQPEVSTITGEKERTSKLPDKAPSLEPMPESLVGEKGHEKAALLQGVGRRMEDAPVRERGKKRGLGRKEKPKQELQRSNTMLDVRSILPVMTHVTNYEKIDAEARVDAEELVKSGKLKSVVA